MQDHAARAANLYARLGARKRARRVAWRASGGDPQRYAEIMRGLIATGYLYYYDDPKPPSLARKAAPYALRWLFCVAGVLVCGVTNYYWF